MSGSEEKRLLAATAAAGPDGRANGAGSSFHPSPCCTNFWSGSDGNFFGQTPNWRGMLAQVSNLKVERDLTEIVARWGCH